MALALADSIAAVGWDLDDQLRRYVEWINMELVPVTGYGVACLDAALWAFDNANSFADAVLNAANLGDDADTTGAVCGQLAGAYWGESGIPRDWLDGLVAAVGDRGRC